ncbi:MAG: flagellar biosynthesis protein FlgA, partial [Pseudomonadota bacterium]
MNLMPLLAARADAGRPVRAGLIGAGKFGSMFLAQVPGIPGLEVTTCFPAALAARACAMPARGLPVASITTSTSSR